MERQKAARESRVVMYRKYRAGDLPDIQIKHSELIAPLQAVAQVWQNQTRVQSCEENQLLRPTWI